MSEEQHMNECLFKDKVEVFCIWDQCVFAVL